MIQSISLQVKHLAKEPSIPAKSGDYYVKVKVDGEDVPPEFLCGGNPTHPSCKFRYHINNTPTITQMRQSAPPGEVIELRGKIMSAVFGSNIISSAITNSISDPILRVYAAFQLCELKKPNDVFYGITLDDGGQALTGSLKCKMTGTFIGNSNASIIIDGPYGRTLPDLDLLRVSGNGEIYMIQTYAEVTGVSPPLGSTEGGLRLTVTGNNFDTNVKVTIGDTMCEIEGEVTPSSFVCVTAEQSSSSAYPGNRGLIWERWNDTTSTFANLETTIAGLTGSEADYSTSHIDDFFFEDEGNNFVSRVKGFFVPPEDGEYTFHILGNGGARLYLTTNAADTKNPASKVEVVTNPSNSANYKDSANRYQLTKGTPYYIEAIHQVATGPAKLQVAARFLNTKLLSTQTGFAKQERVRLNFRSNVVRAVQSMTITGFSSVSHTNAVYQIQVTESSAGFSDATYQLCVYGSCTEPLTTSADNTELEDSLNDLAFLDISESFTVTAAPTNPQPGTLLTVTFNSERGGLGGIQSMTTPGSSGETLTVTVSQTAAGTPSGNFLSVLHTGLTVPSPLFSPTASAQQVEDALSKMYGTRCSKKLTNPDGKNQHYTFETSIPNGIGGTMTNKVEPFCGQKVLRKPSYLYRDMVATSRGLMLTTSVFLVCFAYRGNEIQNRIRLTYTYQNDMLEYIYTTYDVPVTFNTNEGWHLHCLDMKAALSQRHAMPKQPTALNFYIKQIRVFKLGIVFEFFIDDVYIGRKAPVDNLDKVNDYRILPSKPNDALMESVSVVSSAVGVYDITFIPHDCGYDFPSLTPVTPLVNGGQVAVSRTTEASPPLTGTYDVEFNGETVTGIDYSLENEVLADVLETIPGIGNLDIQRSGDCANFKYDITYLSRPGDVPPLNIDGSDINGVGVVVTSEKIEDGGLWFSPIFGEFLRTFHLKPQVSVVVNDIPSLCEGDCSFEWSSARTPSLTPGSAFAGESGTNITLPGSGFDISPENNIVMLGDIECYPFAVNGDGTEIMCTAGEGPRGLEFIKVRVIGKGYSTGTRIFIFNSQLHSFSPTAVSLGGGILLDVNGNGFAEDIKVFVNNVPCEVIEGTTRLARCILPALPAGTYKVKVQTGGKTSEFSASIQYDASTTPTITNVSPTTEGVVGGSQLTISGSGFSNTGTLRIGDTEIPDAVFTDTTITATLPSMSQGVKKVWVFASTSNGAAVNSVNEVPEIEYLLKITNVFPQSGSLFGGTRVTITGVGLSTNTSLTEVKVGNTLCDVESASDTQIECTIQDTGDVVEITNQGIHKVHGKGYAWTPKNANVKVGDTIEWTWTTYSYINNFNPCVRQTVNLTSMVLPEDGFISTASPNGVFEYRVSKANVTYYYSSCWIEEYEIIRYVGTLIVDDKPQSVEEVTVKVGGYEATYDVNSGVSDPSAPSGCSEIRTPITGCTTSPPTGGAADKFNFLFQTCFTPAVNSFSTNDGTTSDSITILGEGFSSTPCQNEVYIGEDMCTVQSSTDAQIVCSLDAANSPLVCKPQMFNVRVSNRGYANIEVTGQNARRFVLYPMISGISPSSVSINGQGLLTITGSGFQGDENSIVVTVGSLTCAIQSVTYTEITCTMPAFSAGNQLVEVKVGAYGHVCDAKCEVSPSCEITYALSSTPETISVTPLSLDGTSSTVTITGQRFGTDSSNMMVTIGGVDCTVSVVTAQEITCTITNVPVGSQPVVVLLKDIGLATNNNNIQITSQAVISSITPSEGSIHGGTLIDIAGNGFTNDTAVTIDGATCQISLVTLSSVKCMTPPHAAQTGVTVNVLANGVNYPAQTFDYTTAATPQVNSITFTMPHAGETVYINGAGFSSDQTKNDITINSVDCPVTFSSPTEVRCTAPALPDGTHNLVVHVEGKGLSNDDKTVTYVITLSTINPSQGSVGGGQKVTLTGSGFGDTTIVEICQQECERDKSGVQTAAQIICIVPPASGSVTVSLGCNVEVQNSQPSITKRTPTTYTYMASLTPSITNVTPRRGGTGGGVTITIEGSGFGTVAGDVDVKIAGTPCTVNNVVANQVICVTGAHSPPEVTSVKVQVDGNGYSLEANTGDAMFQYVDLWSSPYTWGGMPPPGDGSLVVIKKGQTVVLDQNTASLKVLLIQGGELIFDEADVEIRADNILIVDGGLLQVGTEDQPFQHKAIITGTGHVRTKELPIYGTKSVGVREGRLDLHGQVIDVTWTKLAMTANVGSNTITVKDSVISGTRPWRNGDQIAIASTGHFNSQEQNELHTIDYVDGNGVTIHLTGTLKYDHLGISETIGGHTLEYRAEVAMLTRNILVRGLNDPQWNDKIEKCDAGFNTGEFDVQTCFLGRFGEELGNDQFGVQIIVHGSEYDKHLAQAYVEYVEFNYAGQAFRLGRYPMHYHLNGDMTGSYVKGCAFHQTFNRAVNIHGTHNVLVQNNVGFNVMGGAFFLEDGIETGNIFDGNLLIFVRESSSLQNDDITPAAFWITHPNNTVTNNAAAGGTHFGFWYRLKDRPMGPSRTDSVHPNHDIMGKFEDNSCHSCGWFGLWIFEDYFPRDNGLSSGIPTTAVFRNMYTWNCDKGAELVNGGAVQFENFKMVNNRKAGFEIKQIKEGDFYSDTGALIKDGFVVMSSPLLGSANNPGGIVLPLSNRLLVDGVEFLECTQSNCAAFKYASITGKSSTFSGGFMAQTQNLSFNNVGSNHRGIFDWEFHGRVKDLDGSLIDDASKADWTIATTTGLLPSSCVAFPGFSHPGKTPASICPPDVKFHRFSFNNIKPESLDFKDFEIESTNGKSVGPWARKRMTHPEGWMVYLVGQTTYTLSWVDADHMTNISFDGVLDSMTDGDWVIFKMKVAQKPDCVETDGICVNETDALSLDGSIHFHGDWIYSPNDMTVTYLVSMTKRDVARRKRATNDQYQQIILNFQLFKCAYTDCMVPLDPYDIPPVDVRPSDAVFWSANTSWPNQTLPADGACLTIPEDVWMVADTTIPPLCELILYGTLELEGDDGQGGSRSFEIKTPHIVIMGKGRLIAGFNMNQPFLGNLHIILQGSHSSPNYILEPDGRDIGKKVIGVFGGLDLNGKLITTSWTTLATMASIGDQSINVTGEVGWVTGNEIVITPTGYSAWETETFKIDAVSVSNGNTILTLNDTIKYKHLAHEETINGKTLSVKAEVGLLSRNIIVEGEDYSDLYPESFGGYILVGASSIGTGYARISNVEFYHMGQEGYTEDYDPRYAIAYVDHGPVSNNKPSYVKSNAFHHGFSPAIGVYNTHSLPVEDNVIHFTIKYAIKSNSLNTQLIRNLLVLNVWDGSYLNRHEITNYDHDGSMSLMEASNVVLENNAVSGGERSCYHVPPQSCDSTTGLYSGNIARTCLLGVMVLPTDSVSGTCAKYTGFAMSKCAYFGIYYNSGPSLVVDDVCISDSAVGIFPMIIGPSATLHQYADKSALISNSLIVGKSSAFDCSTDVLDLSDDNIELSVNSRPTEINRRIGVVFTSFTSGSNNCPKKPCFNIMAYQAIKGLTRIEGVTFAGFNNECSTNGAAIATNTNNDDGQHPVEVQGLTFDNVDTTHRVFYHRPRLSTINGADCVDMDCDGLKKALIKDKDNSLLGAAGAVIPQSEFMWSDDVQNPRGLGDYRIPKSMLTTVSGIRIDSAEYKGIIRNQSCEYHTEWQAYECIGMNYEMLIIESMDEDTETRRISPVGIMSYDQYGFGYVDLINGPQDHGWCSGYTCRKRLSTFMALVITEKTYIIHFTGTTPQGMRYFLLNTDDTQSVVLGVWYSKPFRLDVYYKNIHVMPQNGEWKTIGGQQVYNLRPENEINEYVPLPEDPAGTNWYDRDEGMLYFVVRGPSEIEIKTVMAVIISFKYPPATIDVFYGEQVAQYIADFFDIDPEKVRVVNIISANSGARRRKRSTDYDVLVIEIGDEPSYEINGTVTHPLTWEQLQQILAMAVDEGQLGNFSAIVNRQVIGVSVVAPQTVDDPLWATINDGTLEGYRILVEVDRLAIHQNIVPTYEGLPFTKQPKIKVLDSYGNRISELGTEDYPWYVTATLRGGNPSGELMGNTTVQFVDGWANFTNLGINWFGSDYIVDFNISSPPQGENYTVASEPITIPARQIHAVILNGSIQVVEQSSISVTIELRDFISGNIVEDIAWRNHVWNVEAMLSKPELYKGSLSGSTQIRFETSNSRASFSSIQVSSYGMYIVKYHVTSVPSDYDFYVEHLVTARGRHHLTMPMDETVEMKLKFSENYQKIIGSEGNYAAAYLGSWFAHENPDVEVLTSTVSSGSIIWILTLNGTTTSINSTLYATCDVIGSGTSGLSYNGYNMTLSKFLTHDGKTFNEDQCSDDSDDKKKNFMLAIIIACSMIGLALLALIIFCVLWKCKVVPKTKTADFKNDYYRDVDSILIREKSFMSISSNDKPAAPMATNLDFGYYHGKRSPIVAPLDF
ncbi:fibrocystin-L-like [Mytilus californianus]|uniref:fibrocystin-L-like n=1 Tax=Mytilus californianus TaxID=6549 RepID=UPI0022476402|nr:fibrocystin-L-like [Mytilus californianus]